MPTLTESRKHLNKLTVSFVGLDHRSIWKTSPSGNQKLQAAFQNTLFSRNPRREIYNLGMISAPVLLKIKGKSWIFIFWVSKKIENLGRNRSNVGLRSSRLDQNDPQDRRGYFRKIWAWTT